METRVVPVELLEEVEDALKTAAFDTVRSGEAKELMALADKLNEIHVRAHADRRAAQVNAAAMQKTNLITGEDRPSTAPAAAPYDEATIKARERAIENTFAAPAAPLPDTDALSDPMPPRTDYPAPTRSGPNTNVVCHAPGDTCMGCDHYYGKAPVCEYAAPASKLPLSAERVMARLQKMIVSDVEGIACCQQALRAIELERQLTECQKMSNIWFDYGRETMIERNGLEQRVEGQNAEIARLKRDVEIRDRALTTQINETKIADERAEKAEATLALTIEGAGNHMVRAERAEDKLEKAERENADLRHDIQRSVQRNSELLAECYELKAKLA